MMKTTRPIDGNISFTIEQFISSTYIYIYVCMLKKQAYWKSSVYVPMEPPADIEQNSNRPSKTGQSSPTLTDEKCESFLLSDLSSASSYIEQCPVPNHHVA